MCDEPVRTHVKARGTWHPFQEFMIRERAAGPVEDVELRGIEQARPTPEVLEALAAADVVIIGPSNPVISIGPILAVPGLREAMRAPVVAVSPLVRGAVLKGPTDEFLAWAGHPLTSEGIAAHYAGLLDGLVADERADSVPTLVTDVEMGDHDGASPRRPRGAGLRRLGLAVRTAAVLPVKSFTRAKQRLGEAIGAGEREELAAAMVADVLDALAAVHEIDEVVVVTAEPLAARAAEDAGAHRGRRPRGGRPVGRRRPRDRRRAGARRRARPARARRLPGARPARAARRCSSAAASRRTS